MDQKGAHEAIHSASQIRGSPGSNEVIRFKSAARAKYPAEPKDDSIHTLSGARPAWRVSSIRDPYFICLRAVPIKITANFQGEGCK
jgi:hypothetical protein